MTPPFRPRSPRGPAVAFDIAQRTHRDTVRSWSRRKVVGDELAATRRADRAQEMRPAISATSLQIHPLMSFSTTSSTAPPANATTGVPQAMASIITRPNGSSH
jgi:hypothetical protein